MTFIETLLFGRGIRSLKPGLLIYNEVGQDGEHRMTRRTLEPPDGEPTQPDTEIMRVARETPAATAGRLVCELEAEGQDEGEHALHKRLAIAKELKVGRFVLEIDGDGPVLACRLGFLSHLSPPLRWSLALMRHHGGNVLQYQEFCEERRVLPRNPMECA